MRVTFKDVTMQYEKNDSIVLDRLNFTIDEGQLVSILGPSGCGKSTTLMLISGLLTPSRGEIFFGEKDVTKLDAVKRRVGMVFQNYALYPHLTVKDNIAFPLKMMRVSRRDRNSKVKELAHLVRIEEHLNKKPGQLSGGQQQRVAIARALAKDPSILLMDEPLSNLDAKLRNTMREEIRRIQQETGVTTIFVTHDQSEALSISDEVMVLDRGEIQQKSEPTQLYDDPENLFVAQFLGDQSINTFNINNMKNYFTTEMFNELQTFNIETIAIRPEHIQLVEDVGIEGIVERFEPIGKERIIHVNDGTNNILITNAMKQFKEGESVLIQLPKDKLMYFNSEGKRVVLNNE